MLKKLLFSIVVTLIFSFAYFAVAEESIHKDDIHKGNVICLLPDRDNASVKPVIGNEPCNGYAPHAHVFVDTRTPEGNVYAVNGSPEAIKRLEMLKNKKNVEVKGKVSGNNRGWIITVE